MSRSRITGGAAGAIVSRLIATTLIASSCGGSAPLGGGLHPDASATAGSGPGGQAGAQAGSIVGEAGQTGQAGQSDDSPDGASGSSGAAGSVAGEGAAIVATSIPTSSERDLDILFMIDNSFSMAPLQKKLVDQFPAFMNVLTNLPGGLPSVHIAVVTSDLGAGQYSEVDIQGCRPGGDQGIFQSTPRDTSGACARGMLSAGQNFIISSSVPGSNNFTGTLADAFGCIALVGDQGCGFEHQLASVVRALGADGSPAPAQNAGFLRPDAALAVILVTNEDDCSAPPNSTLYDPTSRLVSDPLGPLASYRCNEFGHLCGGLAPPRTSVGNANVDLSGTCVSNENGPLLSVFDVSTQLKILQPNVAKLRVAVIAAPPTPYIVTFTPPQVADDPHQWPTIEHSCQSADGTYGDPAVRLNQWIQPFGAAGVFLSVCADSFAPALQAVAQEIAQETGVPCVNGKVKTTTGPNGVRPSCSVSDHAINAQGLTIDTPLPSCVDSQGVPTCWTLAADPACPNGSLVTVSRPAGAPAPTLDTSVECAVCAVGSTDPSCH
jgi:hypothetical protein